MTATIGRLPQPTRRCFNAPMSRAAPFLALALLLVLPACASPKPILYPNDQLEVVGRAAAAGGREVCRARADAAGAHRDPGKAGEIAKGTAVGGGIGAASGAVAGAISGSPGLGTAIGAAAGATAGLLRSLFKESRPSEAHVNFVNRCLHERGYDVVGWD